MKLKDIFLDRGETPVFRGLSLDLSEARIGLIGSNGSGKSSLLRIIKGLIEPQKGTVEFPRPAAGADRVSTRLTASARPGFVFQNPDHQILFPTVMEELCFGLTQAAVAPEIAQARAKELLHRYGVFELHSKATHELSDGQKQLVCILSVLMDEPPVILLDEPFSSLDQRTTRMLMALLKALPQQLIMATHHLELLEDFDRVIWLDAGRIHHDGKPTDVIAAYRALP